MIKNYLFQFAGWFLRRYAPPDAVMRIPPEVVAMLGPAEALISAVDEWDASGEAKRHRVYALLMKDFSDQPKYYIALAIEIVIWRRRG